MNPSLDKALYYLAGNGNLDEVSIEELDKMANDFPYFSVSQLLLAKKLKVKEDKRYKNQLQKAALYFSNPYWLHYQLMNYPPAEIEMYSDRKIVEEANADQLHPGDNKYVTDSSFLENEENNIPFSSPVTSAILQDSLISKEIPDFSSLESGQHKDILSPENIESGQSSITNEKPCDVQDVPITTEFTQEEIEEASEMAHEQLGENEENASGSDQQTVPITTEFTKEEIEEASEMAHEQLGITEEASGEDQQPVPITTEFTHEEIEEASELAHEQLGEPGLETIKLEEHTRPSVNTSGLNEVDAFDSENLESKTKTTTVTEIVSTQSSQQFIDEFQPTVNASNLNDQGGEVSQAEEEMATISREPNTAAEAFIEEVIHKGGSSNETETTNEAIAEPDEHEVMFQNIKAMLDATTDEVEKGVSGTVIPIDPYHTIDYFASQGIKLELEPNPQDKLGKQVKKFTQWLRHMKKLGPEDAIVTMQNEEAESDIQQIADTSNTAREVVTEAMAQVLEKQGKTDKAIQLYTKLSFFNPHKSAYFADKINKLKDS